MGHWWHVACMEKMRDAWKILVGKSEEKFHVEELGIE
jgi:hypothetical protein